MGEEQKECLEALAAITKETKLLPLLRLKNFLIKGKEGILNKEMEIYLF